MDKIKEIIQGMFGKEDSVWSELLALLPSSAGKLVGMVLPFVGLALCAILILFGKKTLPFFKVVVCFVAGFFATEYFLIPLLQEKLNIGFLQNAIVGYAISAVVAVLCAFLAKFIYILAYAGAFGGGVFAALYLGLVVTKLGSIEIKGNYIIAGVAGVVVAVLAFLLRKFIEKLATAGVGAVGLYLILTRNILGAATYEKLIGFLPANLQGYVKFVVIGVLTIVGLIVQIKAAHKYKV